MPKKTTKRKAKPKAKGKPKTAGRPRLFDDPEAMQKMMDEYFTGCDERIIEINVPDKETGQITVIGVNKPEPYTWPGLAYFLGFESRQSLFDYSKDERFSYTIKKAKLRIESQRNLTMIDGKTNVAGSIFDLKNNFGWKDKQEVDIKGDMTVHFDKSDAEL